MIFGKLIGAILGYQAGGFIGALLGLWAGHFFDRGFGYNLRFDGGAERERLQQLFFQTTFSAMGHLAKADGRISEAEIAQAEALMQRLGLTSEHRQQAIAYFKQGAEAGFDLDACMRAFVEQGGRGHNLPTLLLEFLFSMALADNEIHPDERAILLRVAVALGFSPRQFEQLLAMLTAQEHFRGNYQQGGSYGGVSAAAQLDQAYQALGVSADISDRDLKRAYRKLMSQHHPDKLIAQGVPEDMIKMATEKSQEIQAAYELVKRQRQDAGR